MFRQRSHDDFSDEVQAHLDLEADRLVSEGWDPDEARAAALRSFGNVAMAKERFYEASRWMWVDHLVQDLRYGLATSVAAYQPARRATRVDPAETLRADA
jgi:hypothetical protein